MQNIEKQITPFVEQLFPDFYREEYPLFVAFVKAYYQWLGSTNQTIYHARRLPDYRDIDKTLDDFIIYFKEKFLVNIEFTTATNKKLFIKNSLDFYRAKGTERAVDLFFKLVHGIEAKVFYPGDHLFRLSDNDYVNIRYLEIENLPSNVNLVGQTIKGNISSSEAFVEKLSRVRVGTKYIDVLYITNLTGNFFTDENVYIKNQINTNFPRIIGSLTNLNMIPGTSSGFEVGEEVFVTSDNGRKAKAIVSETSSRNSSVIYELTSKGWGYTEDAEVIASELQFLSNNFVIENTNFQYFNRPLQLFEKVTEYLASIQYKNSSGLWSNNSIIYGYDGINRIFEGTIISVTGETEGSLIVNYNSGSDPLSNTMQLYDGITNTYFSDIESYEDITATANVLLCSSNISLEYTLNTATGLLVARDEIYQKDSFGYEYSNAVVSNSYYNDVKTCVNLRNLQGSLRTNQPFYNRNTGLSYNITEISNTTISVSNVVNTFYNGGYVFGSNTSSLFKVETYFKCQTPMELEVQEYSNEFTITNAWSNLVIHEYLNTELGSNNFEFSETNTNINSKISSIGLEDITVKSISKIFVTNPGVNYTFNPYVIIYEPKMFFKEYYDYIIEHDGANFQDNEIIVGSNSTAEAEITSSNTNLGLINAIRIDTKELLNEEIITGQVSGSTASIISVKEDRNSLRSGLNFSLNSNIYISNGVITSLRLIDSGFGYIDNETVTVTSLSDISKYGYANTELGNQGIGKGYFRNRRGFLSSDKYLHDNDFYQEYSYQVLTALPFEEYKNVLKKVLHVAGTKAFGSYRETSLNDLTLSLTSSINSANV